MSRTISENIKAFAYRQVLSYLSSDPEKNVPKVLDWLEKHDKSDSVTRQTKAIREVFQNPDSNWHQLVMSLWSDIDDGERERLFETVVINDSLVGSARQKKNRVKYGCNVPWAILMDPTSACNLKCTGCWAAEYGNKLNLSLEELDDIIRQGEELGTYLYIYSGGEPTVRKKDIITLCERHPECAFLAFTNGTLIDEAFAEDMLRVKNFVPAISVEGFEKDTDARRGEGTFAAVQKAMKILRERKLLFGVSCCYTSKNVDMIGSEEYFDAMVGWGAKFAWFFTYMPVGKDAVPELMASAEQRKFMYDRLRGFRKTKPLFTIDFWNDGEFVGGCIAGGRSYLHISAGGEIEPCAFIHYSDSNIREKTLLEALRSPLFMQYHDNQPFNENMLRPCPVLDNTGKLAEMVENSGAHSTDVIAPEAAGDYCGKCAERAADWAPVADELWHCSHPCGGCKRG
ncbi:MAG TPA: radical SAM protein [Eubacteriales bacterium]|nr:radical SAM protein [Eubacteriales bacterium]